MLVWTFTAWKVGNLHIVPLNCWPLIPVSTIQVNRIRQVVDLDWRQFVTLTQCNLQAVG